MSSSERRDEPLPEKLLAAGKFAFHKIVVLALCFQLRLAKSCLQRLSQVLHLLQFAFSGFQNRVGLLQLRVERFLVEFDEQLTFPDAVAGIDIQVFDNSAGFGLDLDLRERLNLSCSHDRPGN